MAWSIPNDPTNTDLRCRVYTTDLDALSDSLQGTGWLSGADITAAGSWTRNVASGVGSVLGVTVAVGAQTTAATDDSAQTIGSDPSNPRWLLYEVDAAGAVHAKLGAAAPAPSVPARTAGRFTLRLYWIAAAASGLVESSPSARDMRFSASLTTAPSGVTPGQYGEATSSLGLTILASGQVAAVTANSIQIDQDQVNNLTDAIAALYSRLPIVAPITGATSGGPITFAAMYKENENPQFTVTISGQTLRPQFTDDVPSDGTLVHFGTTAGGLTAGVDYYTINATGVSFQVATTYNTDPLVPVTLSGSSSLTCSRLDPDIGVYLLEFDWFKVNPSRVTTASWSGGTLTIDVDMAPFGGSNPATNLGTFQLLGMTSPGTSLNGTTFTTATSDATGTHLTVTGVADPGKFSIGGEASIAGGTRYQTTAAHGLTVGQYAYVTGTTNYNGGQVVTNISDSTHFDTAHAFVSNEGAVGSMIGLGTLAVWDRLKTALDGCHNTSRKAIICPRGGSNAPFHVADYPGGRAVRSIYGSHNTDTGKGHVNDVPIPWDPYVLWAIKTFINGLKTFVSTTLNPGGSHTYYQDDIYGIASTLLNRDTEETRIPNQEKPVSGQNGAGLYLQSLTHQMYGCSWTNGSNVVSCTNGKGFVASDVGGTFWGAQTSPGGNGIQNNSLIGVLGSPFTITLSDGSTQTLYRTATLVDGSGNPLNATQSYVAPGSETHRVARTFPTPLIYQLNTFGDAGKPAAGNATDWLTLNGRATGRYSSAFPYGSDGSGYTPAKLVAAWGSVVGWWAAAFPAVDGMSTRTTYVINNGFPHVNGSDPSDPTFATEASDPINSSSPFQVWKSTENSPSSPIPVDNQTPWRVVQKAVATLGDATRARAIHLQQSLNATVNYNPFQQKVFGYATAAGVKALIGYQFDEVVYDKYPEGDSVAPTWNANHPTQPAGPPGTAPGGSPSTFECFINAINNGQSAAMTYCELQPPMAPAYKVQLDAKSAVQATLNAIAPVDTTAADITIVAPPGTDQQWFGVWLNAGTHNVIVKSPDGTTTLVTVTPTVPFVLFQFNASGATNALQWVPMMSYTSKALLDSEIGAYLTTNFYASILAPVFSSTTPSVGQIDIVELGLAGTFTATLPTAPADRSIVGVSFATATLWGTVNVTVTIAAGGADKIVGPATATTGTATYTLTTLGEVAILQYRQSDAKWYVVGGYMSGATADGRYVRKMTRQTVTALTGAESNFYSASQTLTPAGTPFLVDSGLTMKPPTGSTVVLSIGQIGSAPGAPSLPAGWTPRGSSGAGSATRVDVFTCVADGLTENSFLITPDATTTTLRITEVGFLSAQDHANYYGEVGSQHQASGTYTTSGAPFLTSGGSLPTQPGDFVYAVLNVSAGISAETFSGMTNVNATGGVRQFDAYGTITAVGQHPSIQANFASATTRTDAVALVVNGGNSANLSLNTWYQFDTTKTRIIATLPGSPVDGDRVILELTAGTFPVTTAAASIDGTSQALTLSLIGQWVGLTWNAGASTWLKQEGTPLTSAKTYFDSLYYANTTPLNSIVAPTGDVSINSHRLTNVSDPVAATDAATQQWVLAQITGLDAKPQCRYASTSALPTNTYSNGASGVGATLTATANGALVIDSVTIQSTQVGQRVLVAGEATAANNGWYTITQVGTGSLPYILTRATESDQAGEIGPGYLTPVEAASGDTGGTVNNGKVFVSIAPSPFTVGTSSVTFSAAGGATYSGDETSVHLSGSTFSLKALTGDVTTSAGAVATTIAARAVTYAKFQAVASTSRVLGRITAGSGDVEELTAANLKTILALASTDLSDVSSLVTLTGAQHVTNKRVDPIIATLTDQASISASELNCDNAGIFDLASVSQGITYPAPNGTPVNGQRITIRMKSAASQTIAWNGVFRAGGDLPLPTATTGGALLDRCVFEYSTIAAANKWDLVGLVRGF